MNRTLVIVAWTTAVVFVLGALIIISTRYKYFVRIDEQGDEHIIWTRVAGVSAGAAAVSAIASYFFLTKTSTGRDFAGIEAPAKGEEKIKEKIIGDEGEVDEIVEEVVETTDVKPISPIAPEPVVVEESKEVSIDVEPRPRRSIDVAKPRPKTRGAELKSFLKKYLGKRR